MINSYVKLMNYEMNLIKNDEMLTPQEFFRSDTPIILKEPPYQPDSHLTGYVSISLLVGNQCYVNRVTVNEYKRRMVKGRVEPIRVQPISGGRFFIRNGHHRVQAARELGRKRIRAQV